MGAENVTKIPTGTEFLKLLERLEDDCLTRSTAQLSELGKKAPNTMEHLGTVLSFLDRLASCHWGCKGGDHVAEYLAGRCCSSGRASLRLLRHGYYDESLSLTRSIAETANLLFLFWQEPGVFEQWKKVDKGTRLREFGPAAVRRRLESKDVPVPADTARYSEFCEIATHVTPATRPQAHNPMQVPTLGGYFQAAGFLMSLNELSSMVAMSSFAASRLIAVDKEIAKQVALASVELLRNTGAIDVLSIREGLEHARQKPPPEGPASAA
jgi:hypothetical protein